MIGTLLSKFFGTKNDRELKRLWPIIEQVNSFESKISDLSDDLLKRKTEDFRESLEAGKSLDEILPEAFAAVREVSKRLMHMRHFDVQILGGAVLHEGKISEMKTGEGKTLVSPSASSSMTPRFFMIPPIIPPTKGWTFSNPAQDRRHMPQTLRTVQTTNSGLIISGTT